MEFPTEDAWKKYKEEHPGAEQRNHTIKKDQGEKGRGEKGQREKGQGKDELPENVYPVTKPLIPDIFASLDFLEALDDGNMKKLDKGVQEKVPGILKHVKKILPLFQAVIDGEYGHVGDQTLQKLKPYVEKMRESLGEVEKKFKVVDPDEAWRDATPWDTNYYDNMSLIVDTRKLSEAARQAQRWVEQSSV